MMFIKASANSHGFVNARDIEDLWRDHFDYFYREYDEFIFVGCRTSLVDMNTDQLAHYNPSRCVRSTTRVVNA